MNAQIEKLLNKANGDPEVFARLLIEECVTVIDGMRFSDEGPAEGASYQRTLCGSTIKEYFGLQSKGPISSRNVP